jgi:hypothetical protein
MTQGDHMTFECVKKKHLNDILAQLSDNVM